MATSTSMPKWDFASWTRGHPSSLHRGRPSQVVGLELRAGPVRAPSAEPRPHAPPGLPLARPGSAERLGVAGGATRGLCCGHLGRSSGASQRLGRASFTHAATTGTSGPGVEPWCELHVRGGRGDSRSRRTSKLAVGVLSWRERETAAEEPSAVASQRLPGSPSGGSCPF